MLTGFWIRFNSRDDCGFLRNLSFEMKQKYTFDRVYVIKYILVYTNDKVLFI